MSIKLFTFLGIGDYLECIYKYGDRLASPHKFIQTGLTELLLDNPTEERSVCIFLTKEAMKRNWQVEEEKRLPGLADELSSLQKRGPYNTVKVKTLGIQPGFTKEEVWDIFEIVESQIQDGDQIYFDITHSFRSIPLLSLLLTNYVRVFKKDVEIKGLLYGAFEKLGRLNEVAKIPIEQRIVDIVELKEFIKLLDWSNAADRFIVSGDTSQLFTLAKTELAPLKAKLKNSDQNLIHLEWFIQNLSRFSQQISTCRTQTLISETSRNITENIAVSGQGSTPYVKALIPIIQVAKEKLSGLEENEEVLRSHFLVTWCLQHGKLQQGWTIFRENIITYLCRATGYAEHNLNFQFGDDRELIGKAASVIANNRDSSDWQSPIKDKQWLVDNLQQNKRLRGLALLLDKTAKYRNDLNHAQFVPDQHSATKFENVLGEYISEFERLVFETSPHDPGFSDADGIGSANQKNESRRDTLPRILISPLGMSKGLLYSAIRGLEPDHVVVITSTAAAAELPEIIQASSYAGSMNVAQVADPFTCFADLEIVLPTVFEGLGGRNECEIILNITGGTTALQYLLQQIERELLLKGYSVRKVAFVDRRPSQEQRDTPYVQGEHFELSPSNSET